MVLRQNSQPSRTSRCSNGRTRTATRTASSLVDIFLKKFKILEIKRPKFLNHIAIVTRPGQIRFVYVYHGFHPLTITRLVLHTVLHPKKNSVSNMARVVKMNEGHKKYT